MKSTQRHTLTLLISLCILGFSVSSAINLSTAPIDNGLNAMWTFLAITLTLGGLFISPVLAVMSLGSLVKNTLQPARKIKQKNDF